MALNPKHQRIADALRSEITSGELAPGAQLPSEAELGQRFGVSRTTVRAALAALSNEGLIASETGRGSFVRQRRHLVYRPQEEFLPQPESAEMDQFMRARQAEGRPPTQTIEVAIVTPTPEIATRLALDDGQPAVVRRRVRCLDGEPFNTNDSYYPLSIVQGSQIMSPADIPRGANQVLTDLGYEQVRALDEVYVRMPSPDEAAQLRLGPGTPVAVHVVTGYTATGTPARVVVNVLPGDRHVIAWERKQTETGSA
jgi:DNA-binding GntR family transcriptional regulator